MALIPPNSNSWMQRLGLGWDRFWFRPCSPTPICLFRILFGLLALADGLLYAPDFLVWFGNHGAFPLEALRQFGSRPIVQLLLWLQPPDFAWALGLCAFLWSALFVTLGLFTRASLVYIWIFMMLLIERNPSMWHHTDLVLRLCVLPLLFAPASARFSMAGWLNEHCLGKEPEKADPALRLYAPWAQRMIQVQLWAIYLEAFWGKVFGRSWRDGSAVYYATHFPDGMRASMPHLFDHVWIYHFLTYYTLAVELSLWTLLWYRPARYWVMLAGMILHAGLQAFLNLDLLEFGIVAAYVCFIEPEDLERALAWIFSRLHRQSSGPEPPLL